MELFQNPFSMPFLFFFHSFKHTGLRFFSSSFLSHLTLRRFFLFNFIWLCCSPALFHFLCLCHLGWNHRVTVYSEDCLLLWLDFAAAAAVFVREFMYMHSDHHQHQHQHHHPIAMYTFFIFALAQFFSPSHRPIIAYLSFTVVFCFEHCSMLVHSIYIHLLGNGSYGCYYSCCFCWCSCFGFGFWVFLSREHCFFSFNSSTVFPQGFRFVFKLFASLLHSFMNMYGKSACKCKSKQE